MLYCFSPKISKHIVRQIQTISHHTRGEANLGAWVVFGRWHTDRQSLHEVWHIVVRTVVVEDSMIPGVWQQTAANSEQACGRAIYLTFQTQELLSMLWQ